MMHVLARPLHVRTFAMGAQRRTPVDYVCRCGLFATGQQDVCVKMEKNFYSVQDYMEKKSKDRP